MNRRFFMSILLFLLELIVYILTTTWLGFAMYDILVLGVVLFLLLFMRKHYTITSSLIWEEFISLLKSCISFLVISLLMLRAANWMIIIKCLILVLVMYFACILLTRYIRIIFRESSARKTMVIGTSYQAYRIGKISNNNRFSMTRVLAYIKLDDQKVCKELLKNHLGKKHDHYQIYNYDELDKAIKENEIEQVIIALPNSSKEKINELMKDLFDKVEIIKYLPNLDILMTFNTRIQDFDGMLLISTSKINASFIQRIAKRFIDIIASIAGILLLIPISFYVIYKNRKNGDNGPIFFTQERIGKDGKPIKIYKFRTMVPNAEQILEDLMESNPEIKEEYLKNKKLVNDPRITQAGHFLRKTSLDEFPQFFNVFKGEMSLVGPRPYLYREKDDMGMYYQSIIRCKPGITGMWQANGRSDVSFQERCKLDDYYYRNWNFGLDVIIIYKTIKGVLYGKGAL